MNARRLLTIVLLGSSAWSCLTSMPNAPNEAHPSEDTSPRATFPWPNGARAAVSLTYDDAIRSQLDNAVPALARHGLHATFFLTGSSPMLEASPERYRALVKAGHELGSHTVHHPCDRSFSFVQSGFALQDYDQARMEQELTENIQQLRELGQPAPFSFAYPCGSTWLGEQHQSYVPTVERLFSSARGVNNRVSDLDPKSLYEVPSVPGNASAADLTYWVDRARYSGGWVVFTFHGVAGDYLDVKSDAHEALLTYLELYQKQVWTERFGTVTEYVKAHAQH